MQLWCSFCHREEPWVSSTATRVGSGVILLFLSLTAEPRVGEDSQKWTLHPSRRDQCGASAMQSRVAGPVHAGRICTTREYLNLGQATGLDLQILRNWYNMTQSRVGVTPGSKMSL